MKKYGWKGLLCLMLCGILCFGLFGCSGKTPEASASASQDSPVQINPLPEGVSQDKMCIRDRDRAFMSCFADAARKN